MTPSTKKSNGPTWEDVHNELKVLATKDELKQLGVRLGDQITSLDVRLAAFSQLISESTRQTVMLTAQLAADSKSLKGCTDDHSTEIGKLRTDLTTFQLDSARGDKRVGIIAAALTFVGSSLAAFLGTHR